MSQDNMASLRAWSLAMISHGVVQARLALEALAEIERLRELNVGLAERVAAQSELLTRRAERAG